MIPTYLLQKTPEKRFSCDILWYTVIYIYTIYCSIESASKLVNIIQIYIIYKLQEQYVCIQQCINLSLMCIIRFKILLEVSSLFTICIDAKSIFMFNVQRERISKNVFFNQFVCKYVPTHILSQETQSISRWLTPV